MVTGRRVPVLWITGPAGVGKSTVSWQLFTELTGSGTRAAFADADQLCMCYPAPPDDLGILCADVPRRGWTGPRLWVRAAKQSVGAGLLCYGEHSARRRGQDRACPVSAPSGCALYGQDGAG